MKSYIQKLVKVANKIENKLAQNNQPKQFNAGVTKLLENCFDLLNKAVDKSVDPKYLHQDRFIKAFNFIKANWRYYNSDQVMMYKNLKQYFTK